MIRRQLKHSLAFNFVLAALVPIIFLSIIVLLHLAEDTKKETVRQSKLLAKTVRGQVEIFLHEPLAVLQNISAMLEVNPSMEKENLQQVLDLHIRNSQIFESLFLLDSNGTVENVGLAANKQDFLDDFIGINLAHLPFYATAVSSKKPTWSDTFQSVMSGNMSIALCIPIIENRSLIGNLNIEFLSEFVQSLNENQRVQVALIDRNGTVIVHPDPLVGETQLNISNLSIIQDGFGGSEEVSMYTLNNIKYIGSTTKIGEPEWLVLISQTLSEQYHGVSTTAFSFLSVALAASIMAILFALIKAKKITEPITEVADRAHQIAVGNYNVTFSPSTYSEVNELTHSIQEMADSVKSRENELQMSQKRFREIYNTTSEAIFIRNSQTFKLVDANQAMTNLFGYSLDELKEKSVSDLSSGDPHFTQQLAQEKIYKVLREGPQFFEWNYKRKNDESFWAEVTLKKAEIDGKERILGVIRDITDHKSLELQLMQSQKMEAIGTLAGGIAHDFNNILTPILGYVELAMIHLKDPGKLQEDLREVLKAVQRAKELVQQILTFSRQEGQQLSPTDVGIIVKEALRLLRSSIPSTIEIKQEINRDCGQVMANPTQIHQVLMNLCTNAYHAMREKGGTLGVSLTPVTVTTSDNPALKNLSQGNYLLLEVSDTGHGMDKAVLNRILEPYFTTKDKDKGTGMGLSVVHGIVKSLGGEITIDSAIDQGSTFHIYLPTIDVNIVKTTIDSHELPPGGEECIILVDDEEIILNVQKEMLTGLGYNVKTYSNPEDALQQISNQPDSCDLLITDMTMPKMTGDLLASNVRKIQPQLPIILCTGFSEIINREQALAQGIDEFLTKPIELRKLANTVRKTLDSDHPA